MSSIAAQLPYPVYGMLSRRYISLTQYVLFRIFIDKFSNMEELIYYMHRRLKSVLEFDDDF